MLSVDQFVKQHKAPSPIIKMFQRSEENVRLRRVTLNQREKSEANEKVL